MAYGTVSYHAISAASTNATSSRAAGCILYGYAISNNNAAVRFIKFYDKGSAPTVGTDVPVHVIMVPANSIVIRAMPGNGMSFYKGCAWATTTGLADNDTGAVGASDLIIDFMLDS
jgi:hypothetical protein